MEDDRIIDLYWQRNEDAIRETDKKYGKYCFQIAHNILYDREDSKECVNDTWIRTWETIPPERPGILSAYLAKITRNLALHLYEKKNAKKRGSGEISLALDELSEVIGHPSDVEENVHLGMLKDSINTFLSTLDTKTRIIFIQRYFYFLSIEEITRKTSSSQGQVKMTLSRTREKLRIYLKEEGYDL